MEEDWNSQRAERERRVKIGLVIILQCALRVSQCSIFSMQDFNLTCPICDSVYLKIFNRMIPQLRSLHCSYETVYALMNRWQTDIFTMLPHLLCHILVCGKVSILAQNSICPAATCSNTGGHVCVQPQAHPWALYSPHTYLSVRWEWVNRSRLGEGRGILASCLNVRSSCVVDGCMI